MWLNREEALGQSWGILIFQGQEYEKNPAKEI